MFKFLKEKLSSWFGSVKSKEKEEKPKKEKKKEEKKAIKEKPSKKEKAVKKAGKKIEKVETEEKIEEIREVKEEKPEKKGFFARLKERFTKTEVNEKDFEEIFEQLELILLENNVAYPVVEEIRKELKNKLVGLSIDKGKVEETIRTSLKETIQNLLIEPFDLLDKVKEKSPYVIVFFGINGSGKTTTIAKIAHMLKKNKISSVIAAADTFRAASIEQLEEHGRRIGIDVIKQKYGADPAAVAFDAVKHAKARGIQVVLIDTAGRMHTKENLMREMEKIVRVVSPDLKVFIAESITGNDVVEQAKVFDESVGIDAIILSKADIDEKGGAILSVGYVTRNPIIYLGVGQEYDKLERFDKKKFIDSLGL